MAKTTEPTADELAAAEIARLAEEDKILVTMFKNGEQLKVHPSCVNGHKVAGWAVVAK